MTGIAISDQQMALLKGQPITSKKLFWIGVDVFRPHQELVTVVTGYSVVLMRNPAAAKKNALIDKAARFAKLAEYLQSDESIRITLNHPRKFESKTTQMARTVGETLAAKIRQATIKSLHAQIDSLLDELDSIQKEPLEPVGNITRATASGKVSFGAIHHG